MDVGVVAIKGIFSGRYLAMNDKGRLYASVSICFLVVFFPHASDPKTHPLVHLFNSEPPKRRQTSSCFDVKLRHTTKGSHVVGFAANVTAAAAAVRVELLH